MTKDMYIKRGDIFYIDLGKTIGSEVEDLRPCVVIQNNKGNKHSPTTVIIPISHRNLVGIPTQVELKPYMQYKYKDKPVDGIIMAEQIRTVDKRRIKFFAGRLNEGAMKQVEEAILVSIGIDSRFVS